MVEDGASTHKMGYIRKVKEILNLERHQNCTTGSRVRAILLKGGILPIGGVALGRVYVYSLRRRLVFTPDTCHNEAVYRAAPGFARVC